MKKILILLVGGLAAFPSLARDFTYEYKGQTVLYTVLDEEAKTCTTSEGVAVANKNYIKGDLEIPSIAVDGATQYTVTEIAKYSFYENKELTSVTIPASINNIGQLAFGLCPNLKTVRFEDSSSPVALGGIVFHESPVGNLYLGRDWTSTTSFPFQQVVNLTIGDLVTTIPEKAFWQSGSLVSAHIGNGVQSIGASAFWSCRALADLTMGSGVKTIGEQAFYGCGSISSLKLSDSLENIGQEAFRMCQGLQSIVIPDAVKSIGNQAFHLCQNLSSVVIGNSVRIIGDKAFANCLNINSLTLGQSVEHIGASAFDGCHYLSSLNLPETLKYIGNSAFSSCSSLKTVFLPASVNHVGDNAFADCRSLVKSAYPSRIGNPFQNGVAVSYDPASSLFEDGWIFGAEKSSIIYVPHTFSGSYTLPESVKAIGPNAFTATGLSEFNSPRQTPVQMADNSFSGLYSRATLNIPDGTVRDYLLTNWSLFDNIRYGEAKTEVKSYSDGILKYRLLPYAEGERPLAVVVPGNYSELTEVLIPERFTVESDGTPVRYYVDAIGFNAFKGCTGLTTLSFHSRSELQTIAPHAFDCTGITGFTLPTSVSSIGEYAFAKEQTVACGEVVMPVSLKTVGASAFSGFAAEKVTAADLTAWCSIDFANAAANPLSAGKAPLYIGEDELTELTVPAEITEIKPYSFASCGSLTTVNFGPQVAAIGSGAFADMAALALSFDYSPEAIDIAQNAFRTSDGKSIASLRWDRPMDGFNLPVNGLETLVIGNTVPSIPAKAFRGASLLSGLSLGSSLTEIGAEAFSGCTSLTKAILPPYVETIGASAFAGNSALATVAMGHSVTSIGEKAFDGCPVATVSITAQTPPTAPDNTFSRYTATLNLQGEKAVDDYYDAYTCWGRFDGKAMTTAESVQLQESSISGKPGETIRLTATVTPSDATLPYLFWRSTNPEIATVDGKGLVTIHNEPDSSCSIIAETLYADGPVATVQVKPDETTSIESVNTTYSSAEPAEIYNLGGVRIMAPIETLAPGIYIVRQGQSVKKISVK